MTIAADEIRKVINEVEAAFSGLDIDRWFRCFDTPCLIVLPQGAMSPSSAAECRVMLEPHVEQLRAKGFERTQLESCTVKMLTDATALATTDWTRFGSGSTVIEELGATYLFRKSGDNWRISMVTPHAPLGHGKQP